MPEPCDFLKSTEAINGATSLSLSVLRCRVHFIRSQLNESDYIPELTIHQRLGDSEIWRLGDGWDNGADGDGVGRPSIDHLRTPHKPIKRSGNLMPPRNFAPSEAARRITARPERWSCRLGCRERLELEGWRWIDYPGSRIAVTWEW